MSLYDEVGGHYDRTRRADPVIAGRLYELLQPEPGQICLDIGCGTGNYTIALAQLGLAMTGVDASAAMIAQARAKAPEIPWHVADATQLPFPDRSMAGATCVLAVHHMAPVLSEVFSEAFRVLDDGRLCIFTADPEQIRGYWLRRYFPELIERAARAMPTVSGVCSLLRSVGFTDVTATPYEVTADLADLFLYAGKHRPSLYLDPAVRAGMSSFATADSSEIESGLARLEDDIATSRVAEVLEGIRPGAVTGDYMFISAAKGSPPKR